MPYDCKSAKTPNPGDAWGKTGEWTGVRIDANWPNEILAKLPPAGMERTRKIMEIVERWLFDPRCLQVSDSGLVSLGVVKAKKGQPPAEPEIGQVVPVLVKMLKEYQRLKAQDRARKKAERQARKASAASKAVPPAPAPASGPKNALRTIAVADSPPAPKPVPETPGVAFGSSKPPATEDVRFVCSAMRTAGGVEVLSSMTHISVGQLKDYMRGYKAVPADHYKLIQLAVKEAA